ncbi:hypothetical protein [Aliamphritea ceti]|uniref:hypothetical protein n=1 Tax=Aliamphritea ceti TaxID=1524258 RepID=UPI0021C49493|nr:hypothetical protein [Aliamphritea ceti]
MNTYKQQGAVLFTLLFFLPIISWLSILSWQNTQLHLETTSRHQEQQLLITQAQQTLRRTEKILEAEYLLPFDKYCSSGRCRANSTLSEDRYQTFTAAKTDTSINQYLLEKIQPKNLKTANISTRYKIHIRVIQTETLQTIRLSAIYKIRKKTAIRQTWLFQREE